MMPAKQPMSITRGILYGFTTMMLFFVVYGIFSYYSILILVNLTRTIYNHPLVVSNAPLQANANVLKISIQMRNVLSSKDHRLQASSVEEINVLENKTYTELKAIQDNIIGEEGQGLVREAVQLLGEWKSIRENVIRQAKEGNYESATELIHEEGMEYALNLENKMYDLSRYARNKASEYLNESENQFLRVENWSIVIAVSWFFVSGIILFLMVKRAGSTEKLLAHEKEKLNVTLKSVGDGVIATNQKGEISLINRVAEKLTGWKEDEVLGKNIDTCFNVVDEVNHKPCDNPLKKVLATNRLVEQGKDILLISRDGTERIIADSGAPINDQDNNVLGAVLVFRDQTKEYKTRNRIIAG